MTAAAVIFSTAAGQSTLYNAAEIYMRVSVNRLQAVRRGVYSSFLLVKITKTAL